MAGAQPCGSAAPVVPRGAMASPRVAAACALLLLMGLLCLAGAQDGESACGDLEGECNECICCCYRATVGLVKYRPDDKCGCKADLGEGFGISMGLLGATTIVSIFSGCYFGGRCPVSPYRGARRGYSVLELIPISTSGRRGGQ